MPSRHDVDELPFDRGLEGQKNRVDVDAESHETEVSDRIEQHQNDEDVHRNVIGFAMMDRFRLFSWDRSGFT